MFEQPWWVWALVSSLVYSVGVGYTLGRRAKRNGGDMGMVDYVAGFLWPILTPLGALLNAGFRLSGVEDEQVRVWLAKLEAK